jgi:hypothetical protein
LTAYEIRELIHDRLNVEESKITRIQIEGPKRHLYIKFEAVQKVMDIMNDINECATYEHPGGQQSRVMIT